MAESRAPSLGLQVLRQQLLASGLRELVYDQGVGDLFQVRLGLHEAGLRDAVDGLALDIQLGFGLHAVGLDEVLPVVLHDLLPQLLLTDRRLVLRSRVLLALTLHWCGRIRESIYRWLLILNGGGSCRLVRLLFHFDESPRRLAALVVLHLRDRLRMMVAAMLLLVLTLLHEHSELFDVFSLICI